jgi:hypothetical protein
VTVRESERERLTGGACGCGDRMGSRPTVMGSAGARVTLAAGQVGASPRWLGAFLLFVRAVSCLFGGGQLGIFLKRGLKI